MGIFSTLGRIGGTLIGGPAGGAIGGAIGGGIDGRKAAKDYNKIEMDKFVRLRSAAEKGGFHPLEALRSGQQVGAQSTRLFSNLSASNAFDALEDEITGEGAKQRKREQVEDEIRERELDKQRYDVAQQAINPSSITRTSPRLPPTRGYPESTPPFKPSSDLTFGTPITKDEIESTRATITQTGPIGGERYEDPSQQDMSAFEDRDGDFEPAVWLRGAQSILNREDYNQAIRFTATRSGKTVAEIHEWVASDPTRRDSLPGLTERAITSLQEAFQAFATPGVWGGTETAPTPKPNRNYRLAPSTGQSLYNQ